MIQAMPTLRAQVAATRLELEGLERRVRTLEAADPALYQRFKSVLEADLAARATDLAQLAEAKGAVTQKRWQDFSELKAKCDELLAESYDFIQGALVRGATLDDGLCTIADRMLDGLSKRSGIEWCRLTVPADGEFVSDLAQIVRLRAGDVSIWHLPVAAHEFGHFIGPRIKAGETYPFNQILERYRVETMPTHWSHSHEFFADAFATYATGPAFLAACVISRFDPGEASRPTQTHPPHAERVFLMSRILEAMDEKTGEREYPWVIEHLGQIWSANLAGTGRATDFAAADIERLTETAATYFRILDDNVADVRYTGMGAARRAEDLVLGQRGALPPTVTIADVLNGAWLSRINQPIADVPALRLRGSVALTLAKGAPG